MASKNEKMLSAEDYILDEEETLGQTVEERHRTPLKAANISSGNLGDSISKLDAAPKTKPSASGAPTGRKPGSTKK